MSPNLAQSLLMFMLVLQRIIAPLVTGVPTDPVCFIFLSSYLSNSCLRAQESFPWHAWQQQTAWIHKWMHCLPRYASVLKQSKLECFEWFQVRFTYCMLKSDKVWCLIIAKMFFPNIQYIRGGVCAYKWYWGSPSTWPHTFGCGVGERGRAIPHIWRGQDCNGY